MVLPVERFNRLKVIEMITSVYECTDSIVRFNIPSSQATFWEKVMLEILKDESYELPPEYNQDKDTKKPERRDFFYRNWYNSGDQEDRPQNKIMFSIINQSEIRFRFDGFSSGSQFIYQQMQKIERLAREVRGDPIDKYNQNDEWEMEEGEEVMNFPRELFTQNQNRATKCFKVSDVKTVPQYSLNWKIERSLRNFKSSYMSECSENMGISQALEHILSI